MNYFAAMHRRINTRAWLVVAVGVAALVTFLATAPNVLGQAGSPRVTSVTIDSITTATARVTATFSEQVEARVVYGKTITYGLTDPADPATFYTVVPPPAPPAPQVWRVAVDLGVPTSLEPGTTYHFKFEIRRPGWVDGDPTWFSSDRSFTTKSGTGVSTIAPQNVVSDCIDTRCDVFYTTSVETNVQLRWDVNAPVPLVFNNYGGGAVGETGGAYVSGRRSLRVSGLSANSTYHFMLETTDALGGLDHTGDLQMVTSANADDHVFTTGACADGTPIDQCSSVTPGAYCASGGNLEFQCGSRCGFNCPSGQTCGAGNACLADPRLTGSPYQCNRPDCYQGSGNLIIPALTGCYATWPKCSANTILKVRKDRACNLWLTCGTAIQLPPSTQERSEDLCLSLAACNSMGRNGQCNKYLPQGQCDNNPLRFCSVDADCEAGGSCNNPPPNNPTQSLQNLTFTTPEQIKEVANLSGNVVAGLDWGRFGGANVISGFLPWQLMRQIGGNTTIRNSGLEDHAIKPDPWRVVPFTIPQEFQGKISVEFEDKSTSNNRVLRVNPVTTAPNTNGSGTCTNVPGILCTSDAICASYDPPGTCSVTEGHCSVTTATKCYRTSLPSVCPATETCVYPDVNVAFAGAATDAFTTTGQEYYYGEVRVRAIEGTPTLRVQFGHGGYRSFIANGSPTFVDVKATSAWQRVGIGPIRGMSGETRLAVVCADITSCTNASFEVDDAQVKPVLQVNNNPAYITPSCRLYPKDDAPACDFTDPNGISYKGWRGYCLENDSITGTCLSWWPVDIIKGESGIFGADTPAGYDDQTPLYFCAQADGLNRPDPITNSRTFVDTGATAMIEGSDPPHWLFNQPVLNMRSMATVLNLGLGGDECRSEDDSCDDADHCGGVENRGECKGSPNWDDQNGTQRGFCGCVEHDESILKVAAADDQEVHKYEVDYFMITQNRLSHGEWNFGTVIMSEKDAVPCTVGAVSYDCWVKHINPTGGNEAWFNLYWDRTDQHLAYIYLRIFDGSGEQGGFFASGMFAMKMGCSKVVQVVQPGGRNQAFASRVKSTVYSVPDVGYTRSQDFTPYGAVVPPEGLETPEGWPRLSVEKPNFSNFEGTAQARAGSPYACVGDCSTSVCNLDPWNNKCDTPENVDRCQNNMDWAGIVDSDLNGDGIGDGQCVGVKSPAISNRTTPGVTDDQNFSTAIDPSAVPNINPICYMDPGNDFMCNASAATPWLWGVCTLAPDRPCQVAFQCIGVGTCGLFGSNVGSATNGLRRYCQARVACSGENSNCTTAPTVGTKVNYTEVAGVTKFPALNLWRGTCYFPTPQPYKKVIFGVENQYFAQQHMRRLFAEGYGVWEWNGLRYAQNPDLNYRWIGPTEICPDIEPGKPGRPAFPQDFCSVPPALPDDITKDDDGPRFLSGIAKTVTITGGSGSIGIRFNTAADPDQLPLKQLKINWGDGVDYYGYPFAPKTDPSKPHIFSHVYTINPADTADCHLVSGRTVCDYTIRIEVEDNWGWCSDAARNGDPAVPDNLDDRKCIGESDPDSWPDTGLHVIVEP